MEEQKEFPGVTAQVQPVIDYPEPDGANPAQVLGYLQPITPQEIASRHLPVTGFSGVDLVGQAGLEAQYDSQLRGQAGTQVVSVNAAGDVTGTVSQTPPTTGDDLVTSINAQIQADVQNALKGAIDRSRAEGNAANQGAAVVMTTTGRVVAMASYPDYNPSVWTGGISQQEFSDLFGTGHGEPIINWAAQGQYAPGFDLQGHLDRRRRGRRVPAGRPVQLPRLGQHRQPQLPERRQPQPRRHDVRRGADPVLRHRVLPARLRHVPAATTRRPTT